MKIKSEKGIALPLVMIAVMLGALVIPPFLENVDSGAVNSRYYAGDMNAQYAADAGAEHAIWSLVYGGVSGNTSYALPEDVNGFPVNVTIIQGESDYTINVAAGGSALDVVIIIDEGTDILSWKYN
jgi:hypothetical protein